MRKEIKKNEETIAELSYELEQMRIMQQASQVMSQIDEAQAENELAQFEGSDEEDVVDMRGGGMEDVDVMEFETTASSQFNQRVV